MEAFRWGELPRDLCTAKITLIPKPGKPLDTWDSYRPVSLLNATTKVLAKVLANKLQCVISDQMHPDQNGFVPRRSTKLILRHLHNNIMTTDTKGIPLAISLVNKAFESIKWTILFAILSKVGFGPRFLKWTKLLYTRLNGAL